MHTGKRVIISLIFIFLSLTLFGYTRNEIEDLRKNSEWIVGYGESYSEHKADEMAINDLLSQITVQVEASFENIVEEENGKVRDYCLSALSTYSSARLDGAERSIFEDDGEYIVYRYIRKADKNRIFENRGKLIKDYARRGFQAEKELRIGDALMNYYWSLVLLRTHPDWDVIDETFDSCPETLITYLPDRIRRIYSLIDLTISNKHYDSDYDISLVEISALYKNSPIRNLDFKFYHGNDWSMPVGVFQGKAPLEFMCKLEDLPETLKLNIMYNDPHKASHNRDLRNVLDNMPCPAFREARFEINLSSASKNNNSNVSVNVYNSGDKSPNPKISILAKNIINTINKGDIDCLAKDLTSKGKADFQDILLYGQAKALSKSYKLKLVEFGGKTYLKGISAQFSFPNSDRKFSEELVFVLNDEDKIDKVNFALSPEAVDNILAGLVATDEEKFQIIQFIEEYKTAYCTEDVELIEKIFDDNALIIVGQMVEDTDENIDSMYRTLGRKWRPMKYSKKQYIRNLKSVFSGNEYVNIHFEDNKVSRVNSKTKKIFGIQIHQYYYSQNYSDEGFLFLMFDLTEIKNPKIYVRTWQPEKNPDGTVYGLEDFYLPKR